MKRSWGIFAISILLLMSVLAGCGNTSKTEGSGDQQGDDNKEYVIKFAHVVSASTAKGKAAEKFKELLEERTDGQIKVEVYPDSQLGTDREILEQMQSGSVQMNAPFTGVLPSFVKQFEVFDLPFLFNDREHVQNAVNGELGDIFNKYLESQGLMALGYWDGGFKHLTNSKHPIKSPKDLDGLKMRVSQSPLLISQFEAMGAGGVSVDFAELYTALQTKTVDGQENPLSNIVSKKFYEVQDYLTLSGHGYMGYPLIISSKFYQELPADLQTAIDEVSAEVTEWQWGVAAEDEEAYMKTIEESGIEVTELSDAEKEAFIEATSSVYEDFKKVEGSQELLDAIEEAK
ncbi:TRAP transporter substrate-binding protein [Mesobacillus maritimus]|uniref:TRAP transporter substrate-binding protein n=1 Tax=Mesobacillus maritimus TaxID=1643336 RepID=A0ABS7K817_9BACI|nr:TRAP transporter substrate-binding protein [Mesobacillus maritimus]MBY0098391.1 TRAP transporter substrate-binding protein [Mesobacillus maritimus]